MSSRLSSGPAYDREVVRDAQGNLVYLPKGAEYLRDIEVLDDQGGSGSVLTFTFSQPQHLVYVYAKGGTARALDGPTATRGVPIEDGVAFPIPLYTEQVQVFAPTGCTVSVWGFRY